VGQHQVNESFEFRTRSPFLGRVAAWGYWSRRPPEKAILCIAQEDCTTSEAVSVTRLESNHRCRSHLRARPHSGGSQARYVVGLRESVEVDGKGVPLKAL